MPLVLHGAAGPVELLTYPEAADLLGMRPQSLRWRVMTGTLHAIRVARTAQYPTGSAFLLADEVAWYNRRRRGRGRALADVGPSPYAARYAELLDAGAPLMPLLAADTRDAAARALAQLDTGAPAGAPTPAIGSESEGASDGLAFLAGVGMLLIVALAALVQGRQPDAATVAHLRTMPGAAELPRALRAAADLLDDAA